MSLFKCLLVASLLSQAAPAAHGEAHCPGNVASLTLRLVQGTLIVVAVEANHSGPYDFLVDTGAQVNTIDVSLAAQLHLKPQGTVGVGGAATFSRREEVTIDTLAAGHHAAANSLAVVEDLAQLRAADPRIRGILGGSFLQHFDMLIDNGQRLLCLDDSGALMTAVKGERIKFAEPYGTGKDLPFTRPIVLSARLSSLGTTPVILRLDSGSNVPMLYANNALLSLVAAKHSGVLKRTVSGVEQQFAVLPPQDVEIGKSPLRQVAFTVPMNAVGNGQAPREDGLLPTIAYRRVFISCSGGYVALDPW